MKLTDLRGVISRWIQVGNSNVVNLLRATRDNQFFEPCSLNRARTPARTDKTARIVAAGRNRCNTDCYLHVIALQSQPRPSLLTRHGKYVWNVSFSKGVNDTKRRCYYFFLSPVSANLFAFGSSFHYFCQEGLPER